MRGFVEDWLDQRSEGKLENEGSQEVKSPSGTHRRSSTRSARDRSRRKSRLGLDAFTAEVEC